MSKVSDVVDYTEVPYLQEILNYLPIDPADEEDVNNYIQNITNLIAVNYKYMDNTSLHTLGSISFI